MQDFHLTKEIKGYLTSTTNHAERVDETIDYILKSIAERNGCSVKLVSIHVFEMETQALPPRHETFLTVIAEQVPS